MSLPPTHSKIEEQARSSFPDWQTGLKEVKSEVGTLAMGKLQIVWCGARNLSNVKNLSAESAHWSDEGKGPRISSMEWILIGRIKKKRKKRKEMVLWRFNNDAGLFWLFCKNFIASAVKNRNKPCCNVYHQWGASRADEGKDLLSFKSLYTAYQIRSFFR